MNSVTASCYGDKRNYMLVNYDGKVFCCTGRAFTEENTYGHICEGRAGRMECRLAPMCGGGCRTHASEFIDDGSCMYNYSEADKDEIVLECFEDFCLNKCNKC